MRVLSISSQTIYGPVGNSAAVPALQAAGHEVLALPTILLSHHPGHGVPAGMAIPWDLMQEMLTKLAGLGALADCDAVMTGYFASAGQVEVVAQVINTLKAANTKLLVLVDPVMGDGQALYVKEEIASAIKAHLVPLADILTPNLFELSWLTGENLRDRSNAVAAARRLGRREVLVTSVPTDGDGLETILVTAGAEQVHRSNRLARVPNGTGDFLAGAYLAERMKYATDVAFVAAMRRLDQVVAASAGSAVLNPLS